MSPELLDPEIQDHRRTVYSDCYALGMVIYEVLGERTPFCRHPNLTISWKVVRGERPDRPEGAEGWWFTDDIWEALGRCWMPQPGDRPSINDILQCLEKVSSSWTPDSVPPMTGSLTREFTDITALEGAGTSGTPPPDVVLHQSPGGPGLKEAAGIVNGVSWVYPLRGLILTRSPIRLHLKTSRKIRLFVSVIHRLRGVRREGPP